MLKRIKYTTHIKKLCLLLLLTGSFASSYAQSAAQNYIRTRVPRRAIATLTRLDTLTPDKDSVQASIQYIDGLGRPVQTVQVKASPNGFDMVQPVTYDGYGREAVKYLPYAASTTTGVYQTTAFADQMAFYNPAGTPAGQAQLAGGIAHIISPFAQTMFEASPLNRVKEQGAPGDPWQPYSATDHTVKMDYQLNNDISWATDPVNSRQVAFYSTVINANQSQTLTRTATYVAGDLSVTVSKDENWASGRGGTVEEYKDKEGRVVLKRTFNTVGGVTTPLSTYYVYDDYGNLAYVLPPKVDADNAASISQTTLDNLCYQYRYDERQRLTQKKLPGKGWEFIIYNKLDQVVAMQDAVQRGKAPQEFTISKYDAMGRVILTGIYLHPSSVAGTDYRAAVQTLVNNQTTLWETPTGAAANNGYTSASFPATVSTTLTVNYFDDYSFAGTNPYPYASGTVRTRGLPTGVLTNILGTSNMLWSVIYSDEHGRNIKAYKQHYLGGGTPSQYNYDEITNTYNFNDQVNATTRRHYAKNTGGTAAVLAVTVANNYDYDHMGRKVNTWEQISNGALTPDTKIVLARNDYNEIGQLKGKKMHSTDNGASFKQTIAYTYNERGWFSKADAPLFEESLQYNTGLAQNGLTPGKQYNGNIAAQSWGTTAMPDTKTYVYQYDLLNRLTAGISSDNYNESNIEYDLNGNINKLKRTTGSATLTDDLQYTYTNATGDYTNQLQSINDITTSDLGQKHGSFTYAYDANGNMVTDNSKGITGTTGITYNLLNLPQTIASKSTTYTYDATGEKLSRLVNTTKTDYITGIQYDGTSSSSTISFIQTEEGRALPNGATAYNYEYTLTDHLGNSRVNFNTSTGSALPVQTDNYYPFGVDIVVGTRPNPKNNYLYNKKEMQDNLGLYDYGARLYDPVIARWNSIDPLADISQNTSPYVYCVNNPLLFTDKFGLDTIKLGEVKVTATRIVKQTLELALYLSKPFAMPRYTFKEPVRVDEARNIDQMFYNAIVTHSSTTIVKGQLLEKLKKDPALEAWKKKILAQYKANPQLKKYIGGLKLGGPFFSTKGDLEVKLTIRGVSIIANISEANGVININFQFTDKFDLDYQAGRGPIYNGINGVLKPIWMGLFDGRDDMKVEGSWNETIKE